MLKTGKGSATAKSAGSNSEEVPLLGGERIEAVYKELTYLCPYRYGSTNFSVNKKKIAKTKCQVLRFSKEFKIFVK